MEHHFVAHFRFAMKYESEVKQELVAIGAQDKFLSGAEDFYSNVSQIVLKDLPSREELEFVYQRASALLEEGNFYPGIVVAFVVKKLDDWLTDQDESYWKRSLWSKHHAKF